MGIKTFFPNFYMRLLSVNLTKSPAEAVLKIPTRMTKTEVKEYLGKIYNVDVIKVNTLVQIGKWKRLYGKRRIISYKSRNYKKAFVNFDPKSTPSV